MESTSRSSSPKYLKLERSWYQAARSSLPRAQADKVLGAIIAYFFDLEEPSLPKEARLMFEALRAQVDFKRSQSLGRSVSATNPETSPETPRDFLGGIPSVLSENLRGLPEVSGEKPGAPHGVSAGNQDKTERAKEHSTWEDTSQNCAAAIRMPDDSRSVNYSYNSNLNSNIISSTSQSINTGAGNEAQVGSSVIAHAVACAREGQGVGSSQSSDPARPSTETVRKADTRPSPNAIPTIPEVEGFCETEGLAVDAHEFYEACERRGWKDPKGEPICDWLAYLRGWARSGGKAYDRPSMNRNQQSGCFCENTPKSRAVEDIMTFYHCKTREEAEALIAEGLV